MPLIRFSKALPSAQCTSLSSTGAFVATVNAQKLTVRSTSTLDVLRQFTLPSEFATKASIIEWSQCKDGRDSSRILLSDGDKVYVYDVEDRECIAKIEGAAGGFGIMQVNFGVTGDEILVISEHCLRLMIWSLQTKTSVAIQNPKLGLEGYQIRPNSRHLALLTRPDARDVLTIHRPVDYQVIASVPLSTNDAAGLKWSPDGRWLVVWDAPSNGTKFLVFTPDGHLFKTFVGSQDDDGLGLGIKSVDWSPEGNYLAIADFGKTVTLLSGSSFTASMTFEHSSTVHLANVPAWQEQIASNQERSFIQATQPMIPPASSSLSGDALLKTGTSRISFDKSGSSLFATKNDAMPTTLWIWSLESVSPLAVIVHHGPVLSFSWHPIRKGNLMIRCASSEAPLSFWSPEWECPYSVKLPAEFTRIMHARFVHGSEDSTFLTQLIPRFFVSDSKQFAFGGVDREQESLTFDDNTDAGDTMDLAKTGFQDAGEPEDTFHFRKR